MQGWASIRQHGTRGLMKYNGVIMVVVSHWWLRWVANVLWGCHWWLSGIFQAYPVTVCSDSNDAGNKTHDGCEVTFHIIMVVYEMVPTHLIEHTARVIVDFDIRVKCTESQSNDSTKTKCTSSQDDSNIQHALPNRPGTSLGPSGSAWSPGLFSSLRDGHIRGVQVLCGPHLLGSHRCDSHQPRHTSNNFTECLGSQPRLIHISHYKSQCRLGSHHSES